MLHGNAFQLEKGSCTLENHVPVVTLTGVTPIHAAHIVNHTYRHMKGSDFGSGPQTWPRLVFLLTCSFLLINISRTISPTYYSLWDLPSYIVDFVSAVDLSGDEINDSTFLAGSYFFLYQQS